MRITDDRCALLVSRRASAVALMRTAPLAVRVVRVMFCGVGAALLVGACSNGWADDAPRPAASAGPEATAPSARTAAPSDGSGTNPPETSAPARTAAPVAVVMHALPPPDADFDYQLGGAYPPPIGVRIVARDRTESPASGLYNICYVNGFQTQPGEREWWRANHPTLVLRDVSGAPVRDPDWPDEDILDIGGAEKRPAILAIVGEWIRGCAASGFDAVEIDNVDAYTRFPTRLSEGDAVAMISGYAAVAHGAGLAIAQKNTIELVGRRGEVGLDFAIAEECGRYAECGGFIDGYGERVIVVEYDRPNFDAVCGQYPGLSVVLRDRALLVSAAPGYVRDAC